MNNFNFMQKHINLFSKQYFLKPQKKLILIVF